MSNFAQGVPKELQQLPSKFEEFQKKSLKNREEIIAATQPKKRGEWRFEKRRARKSGR